MDLPNLIYKFFSPQSISCKIFPRSSLLPICNIQRLRWKIYKTSFKWGLSCRSVDCFFVRKLYIYRIFIPGLHILLVLSPQKLYQSSVDYFYLPICLWMGFCRYIQICVHILPLCSPECTKKSCIHVWNDAPWYPKFHPDLSKEQVYCFFPADGLFTWHQNTHLIEPVNYHE